MPFTITPAVCVAALDVFGEHITALERVSMVMLGGRMLRRPGESSSLAGTLPAPGDR